MYRAGPTPPLPSQQPQPHNNQNNNAPNYPTGYHPQHSGSPPPPPLQYPIPTYPIQMRPPASPSPPIQQYHQQPAHTTHQHNVDDFLSAPAAQMGMQFGRTAVKAGSEYVEKNFNRYFNFSDLKHYFKVNNSYVANKIKLLLFPWRHRPWSRLVIRSEQNGQLEGFKPPKEDINSPDLYIPAMAFVTYVLLTGIVAGTEDKFHPEVLGINATTGLLVMIVELLFIKIGCYLLNITSDAQLLDFLSYSGYKFIGVIVTIMVSLIAPFWFVVGTFFYATFSNGFFLLRSLKYVVFPDSTNTVQVPQRKKRIHFLFVISALQVLFTYYLIYIT